MTDRERIEAALRRIHSSAGVDGAHHKQWVLDQVVRVLAGDGYDAWCRAWSDGEDGPDTYGEWDKGTPP